jgi:type IV pilus assembly protein PilM
MSWFKPKSFLGIDIGAGGIKVVELQQQKNRPVLFTYGYTSESQDIHKLFNNQNSGQTTLQSPSPSADIRGAHNLQNTDVDRYAMLIKEVCKQAKTTSTSAMVSLPVSSLFHTVVTLPLVKSDEVDRLLKTEIKKLLPSSLEETALDYELIPPLPNTKVQLAVVNAVPKKVVSFYTTIFQKAGLKLIALEPESTALMRSLIGRDTALSMIIDMGAERTNFFIVDNSRIITHQSIEIGGAKISKVLHDMWATDPTLVEQMKYDLFYRLQHNSEEKSISKNRFLTIFESILDPIVKEIEYSFALYLEQGINQGKRPEKIIITGGASFFPYLNSYLTEKFTMKCYVGDPWGRVVYQEGLKPLLTQIGPRMSVAIGLALRGMN